MGIKTLQFFCAAICFALMAAPMAATACDCGDPDKIYQNYEKFFWGYEFAPLVALIFLVFLVGTLFDRGRHNAVSFAYLLCISLVTLVFGSLFGVAWDELNTFAFSALPVLVFGLVLARRSDGLFRSIPKGNRAFYLTGIVGCLLYLLAPRTALVRANLTCNLRGRVAEHFFQNKNEWIRCYDSMAPESYCDKNRMAYLFPGTACGCRFADLYSVNEKNISPSLECLK